MAIETNTSITIECAKNGFLVRTPLDIRSDRPSCVGDMMVFQSQAELFEFLGKHFSFKCLLITADAPKKD